MEGEKKPIHPLVRSFEKIGMGIRTQLEYFYPRFPIIFVSACPEQLQPVSLCTNPKLLNAGLFEVQEMAMLSGSKKDSVGAQRFRFYSP